MSIHHRDRSSDASPVNMKLREMGAALDEYSCMIEDQQVGMNR